jgi:hypothetical protein
MVCKLYDTTRNGMSMKTLKKVIGPKTREVMKCVWFVCIMYCC